MTQRFILDENILILAQKEENDVGERDTTCRQLLDDIIEICHTIVFDPVLWDKHFQQLRSLPPHQPCGPRSVLRLLLLATQVDGKIANTRENAVPFPEENQIPQGSQDDVLMVRLALETGATLVTTDKPLREHLESSGVRLAYNLEVLSPDEALTKL